MTRSLPAALQTRADRYREQLLAALTPQQQLTLEQYFQRQPDLSPTLDYLLAGSEFLAQTCISRPDFLLQLLESKAITAVQTQGQLSAMREALLCSDTDAALDRQLREIRNRAMVRLIWRDFTRLATMQETTAELSALAEVLIGAALEWHYRALIQRFGRPRGHSSGKEQPLVVLGMGKLGAGELNLSSDIDLIFAFPESGETDGEKCLSNQEFFVRLGQKLIKSLDAPTADGFVFRVDMRLRPHGDSGALVQSFDALENYYQSHGRDWERYAMIKARPVAWCGVNGRTAAQELMRLLEPFTYRQYVDYSVIESLRDMKGLINRQVQRKGMDLDVKLGTGGIREVEFVVQMFQLIRGGRDMALRERQVCRLLPRLAAAGCLPLSTTEVLHQAYVFLRNTEHAIQGYADRQTQALPQDEEGQLRLAWVMGYPQWKDFYVALEQHRQRVNAEFQSVIADPDDDSKLRDVPLEEWLELWKADTDEARGLAILAGKQIAAGEQVLQHLRELQRSRPVMAMQASSRSRLDAFMSRLLYLLAEEKNLAFAEVLVRLLPFIQAVVRRSAYLVLLMENPTGLVQLIRLSAASPWIADQLVEHPILLDELLTPESLYAPPNKAALADEMRREVLRLPWDDLEGHMEALRYFRSAHALRVAASEVTNALPLMKASDYLTDLAEVILAHVLLLAWENMVARHGYPRNRDGQPETSPRLIVVGYGKLGGIELAHGSDLDLVFIHDTDSNGTTSGERGVDNLTFYTRLGQRMIHILGAQTLSGKLYEVDMRLRPSGNSGMLVTSLTAFEKYQCNEAWTWEHQALVRARAVAGEQDLAERFAAVRRLVLARQRDLHRLREEVVAMREKMRTHLGSKAGEDTLFHIKQDAGGIVDIEFMVQYAVLAWAHKAPALTQYTDNIRILETLEQADLLSVEDAAQLIEAYKAYRSTGHRLALQHQKAVLQDSEIFAEERSQVVAQWQRLLHPQD